MGSDAPLDATAGLSAVSGSSANVDSTPTEINSKTKTDCNTSARNETEFGQKNEIDFTGYLVFLKLV